MAYLNGFVIPVKTANRQVYCDHARRVDPFFIEHGALRVVDAWGDDVPVGKVTDFRRAVQAIDDETVVFSWIEWPDKATCDAAFKALETNPAMTSETMPFDGKRMIYGSFAAMVDARGAGAMGYVDGFITPVTPGNRKAYIAMAETAAAKFVASGAIRCSENWGDEVPDGEVTDFRRAVKAEGDEVIVFSWVEWPDKAVRDGGWKEMMTDPDMRPEVMPFDGRRMIWGGFTPLHVEEK